MAALLQPRPSTPDLASCSSQSTGEREGTPASLRATTPDTGHDTLFAYPDLTSFAYAGNEPHQTQHSHHYASLQQARLWQSPTDFLGLEGVPTVDEERWTKELSGMGSAQSQMQGTAAQGSMLLNSGFDLLDFQMKFAEEAPFTGLPSTTTTGVPSYFCDPAHLACFHCGRDPTYLSVESALSSECSSPIPVERPEPRAAVLIPRGAPSLARTARTAAKCDWCGKTFQRGGDIPRHKRASCPNKPLDAPAVRPYRCGSCRFTHLRRDKMQKHCQEVHYQQSGDALYS